MSRIPRIIIRTSASDMATATSPSRRTPSAGCPRTISSARRNSIIFEEFRHVAGQAEGALRQAALDEGHLADGAQARGAQSGAHWIGRREQPLEPVQSAGGHQILAAA